MAGKKKTTQAEQLYGWYLTSGITDYDRALEWQRGLVSMRKSGLARDTIIFLQHRPVITLGKDSHEENYRDLDVRAIPVERGGDVTYHGPGQLVVYFIFNLTRRGRDLHKYMEDIQRGIIMALKEFGIDSTPGDENTGVWVGEKNDEEKRKIASIGVAVKQWISFHGAAINLNTDLSHFRQINPCGLSADVMTSLSEITGKEVDIEKFTEVLLEKYSEVFDTIFTPVHLEDLAEDLESQEGSNVI